MKDIFIKYQQYIGCLNYAVFMLILFFLPFPWKYVQPLIVVWLATWALEGRWLQKNHFRFNRSHVPLLLVALLVVWEGISLLWTSEYDSGISEVNRHLPILAIFLISLFGVNEHYHPVKLKIALYVGSLCSILSYFTILYWWTTNERIPFESVWPDWDIWTPLGNPIIALIKHHQYYCMVLLLALCFSGDIYRYCAERYNRFSALLTVGIGDVLLTSVIILSGSRTMMVMLPIVAVLSLWWTLHGIKRWLTLAGVVIVMGLSGLWLNRHNSRFIRTQHDVSQIDIQQIKEQPMSREPRIYIWHTIFTHRKEYGVLGMGVGTSDAFLYHCYEQDGNGYLTFGPHSCYLKTWMEMGPIAALLLIAIMCLSIILHSPHVRRDAVWVSLVMGLAMLTESCFSRMSGLYILLSMCILLSISERFVEQSLR
ncbi:MAG: O-antigen ligase family protein [Paludibacteraceae bacterium]|nr:O-antigen ligase family protein [Paludibacteraceae bacterium]